LEQTIYVHKPARNGEAGEPTPCVDLKHAQRYGYQRCGDQVAAAASFRARQTAAAAAQGEEPPPQPPAAPADPTGAVITDPQGVTTSANRAKPGGTFACPFDPLHGPFARQAGLSSHLAAKHPGQESPAPPA
jgi:hypothetical protein